MACYSGAADPPPPDKVDAYRCPKPTEFAIVFSFGYAKDSMPTEDARFEHLLQEIKQAGFNTIHCTYTDGRLALCRTRGVKMNPKTLQWTQIGKDIARVNAEVLPLAAEIAASETPPPSTPRRSPGPTRTAPCPAARPV